MKNPKKKGWLREDRTRKILEAEGWDVYRSGGSLGVFDLICHHPIHGWKMIQVKSNYCSPNEREAIREYRAHKSASKELWVWKDRARNPVITIF